MKLAGQRKSADESADAELEVAVAREVVEVTQAQFADTKRLLRQSGARQEQLVLVSAFCSAKERVSLRRSNGRLQQVRIRRPTVACCISAPGQGGLPVVCAEGSVVNGGGRRAIDIVIGMQLLGTLDVSTTDLKRPTLCRVVRKTQRCRVQLAGFNVVPRLIGLTPSKNGAFEFHAAEHVTERYDSVRNMGGVEPVMGDRRFGIVLTRETVH